MPELGKAYVQIVPSAKGISGKVEQAIAPEANTAGTSAGKIIATNMGATLTKLGGTMIKAGAIATAVSVPIIAGIKSALGAYKIQNAAETKLTEIYKTRMGASKKAAKATMDLASALQKEGVIGDEVQLSGAQQLATYAKYPSTVNTILPAMNNLLAQQKGVNATSEDATSIANLMGKAMMGQTGALKRVGISFDEAQEKILKTGTEEEKAAMLAEVVTQNVGNMNKVLAETPEGKIQQMKNAMGDLSEQIGATLAPVLANVANFISANIIPKVEQFIGFLQANPVIAQITLAIAGLLAVGGPLLIIVGTLVSSVGALLPIVAGITAPMLGIAAAVAGLIGVLAIAYTRSESFRSVVNQIGKMLASTFAPVIKTVIETFKTLFKEIVKTATSVATSLAPVLKALMPVFKLVATFMAGVLKRAFTVISGVIKTLGSIVRTVASAFSKGFGAVVNVVKGAYDKVKSVIEKIGNVVKKIKDFFKFKVSAPHIPLPHFAVSPAGWKIGDLLKGKIPSLSVKWYATGGIVNDAHLIGIGAGEKGPEAILPLDPFWKKLDEITEARPAGDITINVYGAEGQSVGAIAEEVKRKLIRETKQRRLAW